MTAAQFAIAWTLARGEDVVPIPGTKRIKYLEMNAAAAAIGLSEEDLSRVDEVFPKDAASGLRYPEEMMKYVNA